MCFVLYIASDASIPDIPFDKNAPTLNTQPLTEYDSPVRGAFSASNVKFLGSSNYCGCGYRHLSFQSGEWPEEYLVGTDPEFGCGTQDDHDCLHRFLLDLLNSRDKIELYGCWDGDFKHPPAKHETISVDDIIAKEFFLRERCHYTVVNKTTAESAG